ncbi:Antitoxin DinJ [Commensalibacter sp. Nvir]|uniref:type II toxin-antitoxin system RelB/DinJ family antitoxin n=1 Tax=Commensalibacter sp. Nvir TaxID=3069817 RepID=UPI002D6869E2|nr:Antitoxin DinJ [Commensalibacter sp. Nvir]
MNLQIRIDEDLKEQAQQVANDLGMDLTAAVRIFLKQMVYTRGLPFEVKIPNATTIKAMKEVEKGNLKPFNDLDALCKELDI